MFRNRNNLRNIFKDLTASCAPHFFAGAMTFEEKKFRPREVVKHVLQMASASVAADKKTIHLETDVSEDVPLEVSTYF